MKAIIAAMLALSVLTGVAGTALAVDQFPEDFWNQQEDKLP